MNKLTRIKKGERWEKDPPYHPSEQDKVYLEKEVIEEIGELINDNSKEYQRVIKYIKEHESLHRKELLGEISSEYRKEEVEKLRKIFGEQFNRWPHQDNKYDEFYRVLNNGNWRE